MTTEIAKIDTGDDVLNELLERLEEGQSLSTICAAKRMPHRRTIERWANADDALAADIARARQIGYQARAERAVVAAPLRARDHAVAVFQRLASHRPVLPSCVVAPWTRA